MKSKIVILGLLVILTLSLIACTSTAEKSYTCNDFQANQHIADNIEMQINGVITVTLCSNPTTGFQWDEEARISDATVLEQASHEYVAPAGDTPGAAGIEKYTFKALKAGTTTISLEYSRPWEGGEKAEWTCTLSVTIK